MRNKTLLMLLFAIATFALVGCDEESDGSACETGATCDTSQSDAILPLPDATLALDSQSNDTTSIEDSTLPDMIDPGCQSDTDCAENEVCGLFGVCESPACTNDSDCLAGLVCESSACVLDSYYDPALPGPHAVGVRFMSFVDPQREGEVPFTVWYPAEANTMDPVWDYALGAEDAPVASTSGWPVVLYSHGNREEPHTSVFLAERLASHGYIVAAPAHRYDTIADYDFDRFVEHTVYRTRDLPLTLDALYAANEDAADPWFGKIDAERVAATGHSWGSITVELLAGWVMTDHQDDFDQQVLSYGFPWPLDVVDPRIDVGVSMATCVADMFGTVGFDQIAVPMLYLGGSADFPHCLAADHSVPKAAATPDGLAITIEDATHYAFTNMCEIDPAEAETYQCTAPPRDYDEVRALVAEVVTDFIGVHLRNDPRYGATLERDMY